MNIAFECWWRNVLIRRRTAYAYLLIVTLELANRWVQLVEGNDLDTQVFADFPVGGRKEKIFRCRVFPHESNFNSLATGVFVGAAPVRRVRLVHRLSLLRHGCVVGFVYVAAALAVSIRIRQRARSTRRRVI